MATLPDIIALLRLRQPAGTWLLFWPAAWAGALAARATGLSLLSPLPALTLLTVALGALFMRSAGCIINDLTDRELDAKVSRTQNRPLARGAISRRAAAILATFLVLLSAMLVLPFGLPTVLMSAAALPLVLAYPWMKRITWWPQAFLGLTFNWGALVGWVMLQGTLGWPSLFLYLGGIAWTIGYDTIYAHQDAADDALIGVRSTARLFGKKSQAAIAICYVLALIFWSLALEWSHPNLPGLLALLAVAWHFVWQVSNFDASDAKNCLSLFRSNTQIGWLMLFGIML